MDQHCWEIIQCSNKNLCPARMSKDKPCWEVMEEQNSFQCHYGLCEECIVYLSKTKGALFSGKELEDVMHNRVTVSQVS